MRLYIKISFILIILPQIIKSETVRYSIGLTTGINASGIFSNRKINQYWYPGYETGICFKRYDTKHLGFQLETNYIERSTMFFIDSILYPNDFYIRKHSQIELSFLSNVELGSGKIKFLAHLGPQIAYLINSKTIDYGNKAVYDFREIYKTPIAKFQFGMSLGLGAVFNIKKSLLQTEIRFTQSLTNIISVKATSAYHYVETQSICFRIAYLLPIFKNNNLN